MRLLDGMQTFLGKHPCDGDVSYYFVIAGKA